MTMMNNIDKSILLPRFCLRSAISRFSKHEYKIMFGTATVMACFIFVGIFTIFNVHQQVDLKPSTVVPDLANKSLGLVQKRQNNAITPITCSKGGRSEFCDLKGDIRIDPFSPIVYYLVPSETNPLVMAASYLHPLSSFTVKPYGRNDDTVAMASVRQWSIRLVPESNPSVPNCTRVHDSPGVLFSLGGFSLNFFHAYTDVIVPLFATVRPFNRDVELLATNYQPWVASVHKIVTQALSRYNVVNIDDEQKSGRETHCFSSLTLGLKGRGKTELSINSSESNYTMRDFQQFLKTTYNLKKTTAIKLQQPAARRKPRLLIISRMNTRTFTNVDQIAKLCRDELGYEVTVAEPYEDTSRYARVVNSCDVMVGVHGAGLTNMVFLPEKAVVIQVVPVGLDRDSAALFGEPAGGLGVSYLEYKIGKGESSLIDKYPADDDVFEKPWVVEKRGVKLFRSIYFDNQNVTLDLRRFRPTLLKALELLRQ